MSDDFTRSFFQWLDSSGMQLEEVARSVDNASGTVANWRSVGIPRAKRFACKVLMEKDIDARMEEARRRPVVAFEVSTDRFRRWNLAALRRQKTIEDWAVDGLDALAAEDPLLRTLRVAEEEGEYSAEEEALAEEVAEEVSAELREKEKAPRSQD